VELHDPNIRRLIVQERIEQLVRDRGISSRDRRQRRERLSLHDLGAGAHRRPRSQLSSRWRATRRRRRLTGPSKPVGSGALLQL